MRFAIKHIDITPSEPSYLSGQINRIAKHTDVLDPLYATIIVLEHQDQTFALLGFDLLMLDESLVSLMRSALTSRINIPYEHIFTIPSHTHAGPEVLEDGLFGIKLQAVLPGYREGLVEKVVDLSIEAMHELQEVSCYSTKIEIDGLFTNRNDPNKPIDNKLRMLVFKNEQDEILGSFLNLACHPTILGPENSAISADLFGVLRACIELKYQFPVLISNGAEGDISNRHTRISSDVHELERVRTQFIYQLPDKLDLHPVLDEVDFTQKHFAFNTVLQKEAMRTMIEHNNHLLATEMNVDKRKLLDASNTVLKAYLDRPREGTQAIEYSILKLGNVLLCFLPMELFSSHYLKLKSQLRNELIIVGLSNISIGYLVDEEAYGKTYEGMTSPLPWSEITRFIDQFSADLKRMDK